MLHLATTTKSNWVHRARAGIDDILLDHAHCEKKAASTAMSLIFRYPHHDVLMRPLSELAREELEHFELMLGVLDRRGVSFRRQRPSPYAAELMTVVRKSEPDKLLDTMLCCALIEARSCERMQLLHEHLEEPDLVDLYGSLLESEARHHATYVRLAEQIYPHDDVRARLREVATHEGNVVAAAPDIPRMHT